MGINYIKQKIFRASPREREILAIVRKHGAKGISIANLAIEVSERLNHSFISPSSVSIAITSINNKAGAPIVERLPIPIEKMPQQKRRRGGQPFMVRDAVAAWPPDSDFSK